MDPSVRSLYKRLVFLARSYPGGVEEARAKLKAAFRTTEHSSLALDRGELRGPGPAAAGR